MGFQKLPGLPPHGPLPQCFPPEILGREGLVVEFNAADQDTWVGNFGGGFGGVTEVLPHPDGKHVLVINSGLVWSVDPKSRTAVELNLAVDGVWAVSDALILSRQSLAFFKISTEGIDWHTGRISWDGFQNIIVTETEISGDAWSPIEDGWIPFKVNVITGFSEGGSYNGPDKNKWEKLAT